MDHILFYNCAQATMFGFVQHLQENTKPLKPFGFIYNHKDYAKEQKYLCLQPHMHLLTSVANTINKSLNICTVDKKKLSALQLCLLD